jgi:hypothetical protein
LDEEVNPMIADLETSNALALAIVAPGSMFIVSMHCSIAYCTTALAAILHWCYFVQRILT